MTLPSFSNYLLHVGSNVGSEGKADAFASILNPVPGWFGPKSSAPQAPWNFTSPHLGHTQSLVELRSCWFFSLHTCWISIFSASKNDLAPISILSFTITMSVRLDSQLGTGQNHTLRIIQLVGI